MHSQVTVKARMMPSHRIANLLLRGNHKPARWPPNSMGVGPDPEVPNHVLARSHADAPEIDCVVRVKGKNLHPGDLVDVKVTAADGYDLVGRAVSQAR